MIESTEAIALLLATGILVFLVVYRAQLRGIPNFGLLACGFMALYASLLCTVAEGFVFADALNLVEHAMNLVSTALLVAWVLRTCNEGGQSKWPL